MSKTLCKFVALRVLLPALLFVPVVTVTAADKSSSHVYQITENIVSEIDILREAIGVYDEPTEPDPQWGKSPIHVYSKGLEVLEKISKAQRKLGMIPSEVGEIPLREVAPSDTFELAEKILLQLRSMKEQLYVDDKIEEAEFVGAKMPSQVYENLWVASYMLDGLTPPIKAKDVYRNIRYLHEELGLIATKLGVTLDLESPKIKGRKRLRHVGQQALRALYKVRNLELRLDEMIATNVPNITLVRITPSDIYDMTNMLLAEMVRIKVHLKIELPRGDQSTPGRVKTKEVFAQMLLVVNNLQKVIKAVASK